MAGGTALARFMEARSAVAGRASIDAGLALCGNLTAALDAALVELAEEAPADRFAVVALGSYGRGEQCPHSDVDLMLLTGGETRAEDVARMLYPLWDASLKVGHAVRTVAQAIDGAMQNRDIFTGLLDARLVAGDSDLFEELLRSRRRLVRRQRRWLRRELASQHRRLLESEPWQLQAPNIKEGRGGLRHLHTVRWLEHAEAIAAGKTPTPLDPPLADALETLLATRNALHALEQRPSDRFRQDLAPQVARWLEADAVDWSARLFAAMRAVDAAASQRLGPADRRGVRRLRLPGRRRDRGRPHDLVLLLETLRDGGTRGLDPLPRADWLDRLLPEWEVIRCRPHIAPFHLHPVDTHSMRAVHEARRIMRGEDGDTEGTGVAEAAAALPDESEVLLAALVHDIGKGHEGDHSGTGEVIAERFAARAGIDAGTSRRLSVVAARHLMLPTVATRRDIADERVIRETAELAGDERTLHLLYLVSVADARASGPDVWSPWKAQLMRQLYLRVRDVLAADAPEAATAARLRHEAALEALAGQFPRAGVESHLGQLPPEYVLGTPPEAIGHHIALIGEAAGGTAVRHDRLNGLDRLTVVTPDRPGVLALVAGTLAAHNANVLGGVAYTRDDGIAIEVMHLDDALGHGIDERRWRRILEAVPQALDGTFPVDERLAETRAAYRSAPGAAPAEIPTTVMVDNSDSERYSIVEVSTADRLGLLYAITRALHDLSLDIHLAKVDTVGQEVVDAFYVLRKNGRRVEDADEIERLRRRVTAAVAALDET